MEGDQITKQNLEKQFKRIFDDIRVNYFEFLYSLKFQNFEERLKIKEIQRRNKQSKKIKQDQQQDQEEQVSQAINKKYKFQQEMAQQNKGRIAGLRLIQLLKDLDQLNTNLQLYDLQNRSQLENKSNEIFLNKLKRLENSIPQNYYDK